jgi:hypothetical protein
MCYEYTYRWAQMVDHLLDGDPAVFALLEARDCDFEMYLAGQGCPPFEYTFRWAQVGPALLAGRFWVLDTRDREYELYAHQQGIEFELPFRWAQVGPALLAGDASAVVSLEENDRAFETASCTPCFTGSGS